MPSARTVPEILEILQAQTPPSEISFLPRSVYQKGTSKEGTAVAIPYVSKDFVANRLDAACGPFGWQTQIASTCETLAIGIGILNPEAGEWLWRWDVGKEGKAASKGEKEEVTAAFKRSANQWGIARDLVNIPKLRVKCEIRVDGRGQAKFVRWLDHPNNAIARFVEVGGPRVEIEEEGNGTETEKDSQPTPNEARTMLFSFAVDKVGMTQKEASGWIRDYEKKTGKTVEDYRKMYEDLQAAIAPPPD